MHSIIKNLSKVLALTILSTNFSPSFVLATNPRRNSKAQRTKAKSVAKTIDHKQLFNQQIEKFMKLGEGRFIVDDDFKTHDSYKNAYLMLQQLNYLFGTKYPNVLKKFIEYCKDSSSQFTLYALPAGTSKRPEKHKGTAYGLTDARLHYMFLHVPKDANALMTNSIDGFNARVDDNKYLQAIVSHEFGHLMSFLKCITDYCDSSTSGETVALSTSLMAPKYCALSQEIRDAIAREYGHAPYISRYANPDKRTTKLPRGAELSTSASDKVDAEYFAELFSYIECNSTAPKELKTALHEIIDTWFVDLPPVK